MKKILLLLLLCLCLVGCGKKVTKEWEIPQEIETYIPMEAAEIFYKATKNEQVLPVALLGKQVVSGTNYMFLVQKDNKYYVYTIYNNLENDATIISKKKFDINKYVNEDIGINNNNVVGGWNITIPKEDIKSMRLDENTQKIFEEASEKITDRKYYPLTVLAKLNESGTKYAVIAYGTPAQENESKETNNIYILTLYEDLQGTKEIVSSSYIDLTEFIN